MRTTGSRQQPLLEEVEADLIELSRVADRYASRNLTLMSIVAVGLVAVANVLAFVASAHHPVWQVVVLGAGFVLSVGIAAFAIPMVRVTLRETWRRPNQTSIIERSSYAFRSPVRVVPVPPAPREDAPRASSAK